MSFKISDIRNSLAQNKRSARQQKALAEEAFKASLVEQDDDQQEILACADTHYLVSGPAGSGKTILAMIKAYELEKQDLNYIVLVYTKALKSFLYEKMRAGDFKNINDKIHYYDELPNDIVCLDYILIDEVQDFSNFVIQKYMSKASAGYFLYGDDGQQLYPAHNNGQKVIKTLSDSPIKHFELKRSFRVPQKIATFAAQIDRNNTNIEQNCFKQAGDLPLIVEVPSQSEEILYIANILKAQGWRNVAILLKSNPEVQRYRKLFMSIGLTCEYKHYYSNNKKEFNNIDFSTGLPKVLTYHSSKGLEFEQVFLPNCVHYDPKVWDDYNISEAFFVAITRAKDTLILSYPAGDRIQLLNNIDESTYIFKKA